MLLSASTQKPMQKQRQQVAVHQNSNKHLRDGALLLLPPPPP
jgi:hypothetical protein